MCVPVVNELVAYDALPVSARLTTAPLVLSGAEPREVAPSKMVMVPVGVGTWAVTLAVKVTVVPRSSSEELWVMAMAVGTLPITSMRTGEVTELKLVSPPKTAVMGINIADADLFK